MFTIIIILLLWTCEGIQLDAHESRNAAYAGRIHDIRKRGDHRVTFTASLTHPGSSLMAGQMIMFDRITSNLMDGYDGTTGVYTCPMSGNYFFTAAMTSTIGGKIHAEIVLDGSPVVAVYADAENTNSRTQASNSGVAHCSLGQQVYVKVVQGSGIHGDPSSPLTTFSGYMIWDD